MKRVTSDLTSTFSEKDETEEIKKMSQRTCLRDLKVLERHAEKGGEKRQSFSRLDGRREPWDQRLVS